MIPATHAEAPTGAPAAAANGHATLAGPGISAAWSASAEALADLVLSRVFVRRDVHGAYRADGGQYTAHGEPTRELLLRHFRGEIVVGAHSTSTDGRCLTLAIDIDAHGEGDDPEANLRFARVVADRLAGLGIGALICDSDGKGGLHVRAFFRKPIPAEAARWLGERAVAGWEEHVPSKRPEVFPKQGGVTLANPYGNWIRLPGRHHKRAHWTRILEPESGRWLEGEAAVRRLLRVAGDDPGRVLEAHRSEAEAREKAEGKPANGATRKARYRGDGRPDEATVRDALGFLPDGWADSYGGSRADTGWLGVGMALHDWAPDRGLALWRDFSARCPTKYDPGVCEAKWATFTQGGGLSVGTIFKEAERRGWVPPWKRSDRKAPGPRLVARPPEVGGDPAAEDAPAADDPRPIIQCHDVELGVATAHVLSALEAINEPPEVFSLGGQLAWIRSSADEEGRPFAEAMSHDALRNRMAEAAVFEETKETPRGSSSRRIFPPKDLVRAVIAQKGYSPRLAPPLTMVAESPRFLPDGRLVTTPGYQPEARIFYSPTPDILDIDVPEIPTAAEVDAAKELLLEEYLGDFPFANQASRANALACMLLPFVRPMIRGATPFHLFEASTEGTGKSKLANACAFPSLGRNLPSSSQKEDEAEWRKAITSTLMTGPSHVYFDNLQNTRGWDGTTGPIDSAKLAHALTQPDWKDRLMGGNREVRLVIRCVWMGSGNNVEWSKELARRIVPIRLIAPDENPSERTGFRHDPLERWAAENRRALLRACLILCRNWIAEERSAGNQVMGSYEEYARIMGGILDMAMVPGFLGNRKRGMTRDRESIRWAALVEAWYSDRNNLATNAGMLHGIIVRNPDLNASFADVLGDGKDLSQKQKLGNALQKQAGRVWGGHRIVVAGGKGPGGTTLYRLAKPAEMTDADEPEPEG